MCQLAIIQHLCGANIIPDVTLGSSGGNVAAYVAAAANWKWAGIERIAQDLTQDLFSQSWSNIISISKIKGFYKGNVYDKGNGVESFLLKHFTPLNIDKHEIWTGTYNKNRQKARLFCNRKKDKSILDISCIDYDLTQSMEPYFCNGDIHLISLAGIASASIPSIVPSQEILGEDYIDGGVASASPLMLMQAPILKYIQKNDDPLHLIYVNSVDLSNPNQKPIHNVIDTLKQATNDLVLSQIVIDRLCGHELIRSCDWNNNNMNKEEFRCNYDNMERVKLIQNKIKYSIIEIYPKGLFEIDIIKFTGDDVINAIHATYNNCHCRLWWIQPNNKEDIKIINSIIERCKSDEKVNNNVINL